MEKNTVKRSREATKKNVMTSGINHTSPVAIHMKAVQKVRTNRSKKENPF